MPARARETSTDGRRDGNTRLRESSEQKGGRVTGGGSLALPMDTSAARYSCSCPPFTCFSVPCPPRHPLLLALVACLRSEPTPVGICLPWSTCRGTWHALQGGARRRFQRLAPLVVAAPLLNFLHPGRPSFHSWRPLLLLSLPPLVRRSSRLLFRLVSSHPHPRQRSSTSTLASTSPS